jgi:GT2 family glycosyltransferase
VSIIIKALNEAAHISNCLTSAVDEAAKVNGEVILVDSLSSDLTVKIAAQFPIRIVQFANARDCSCGAAVQLGFQHALGEFIYVLDGDMVLQPGFLDQAVAKLADDPSLAGVGGKLVDVSTLTLTDERRALKSRGVVVPKSVGELGGGGLYRQVAIQSVGYLGNRWLPAFEEAELGMRLRSKGWKLLRLPQVAISHTGHDESNFHMFRRLWKNRRAHAAGMLLRSAVGREWWWRACVKQWSVFATIAIHAAALVTALQLSNISTNSLLAFLAIDSVLWALAIGALTVSKRSLRFAIFSVVAWHYFTLAAIVGATHKMPSPTVPIDSKVLK